MKGASGALNRTIGTQLASLSLQQLLSSLVAVIPLSMSWLELVLLAATLMLIYVCMRRPRNYPPGPLSLPLLGSIPALALTPGFTPHDKLWNLGKKYGPVCGIFLGPKPVVTISGFKAVKHVLARDDLAYRPSAMPINSHFYQKRLGVFFTDGPVWKEQRRFTLRHLRDFGFGRRTMEVLIHEEARVLLEEVGEECAHVHFNLMSKLHVHAVNILWAIMAGKRHDVGDAHFLEMASAVMDFFRYGDPLNIANDYPRLQKLPIIRNTFDRQYAAVRKILDYVEETIAEHEQTYDEGHMRDFIDVYLREMKSLDQKNSSFSNQQLAITCLDLFIGSTETTSSTIGYCIRYMVQHPAVQTKLRQELLREVGAQRLPSMDDMSKLHYGQAVLNEVFRHSGLAPFAVPHATSSEVDILGYTVPQDTTLLINLWSVHMAPEIWGDPDVFRPDRFINQDGTFRKDEHAMFFGFGPRMCLGEPLARYSTFLLFTALLQHFEFSASVLATPPSTEQLQGFTTSPAPYVVAVKRVA